MVTSTASLGSSVSVVTSFDFVLFTVAMLTTFPALISASVTVWVNCTVASLPGSNEGILTDSFSSALSSFTTISFNSTFPVFLMITS